MSRNDDNLEKTGELTVKKRLKQQRLQWFGQDARPLATEVKWLLRCRPKGKKSAQEGQFCREHTTSAARGLPRIAN